MNLGFRRRDVDPNLYFKVQKYMPLILVLYVDDLESKRLRPSHLSMQEGVGFQVRDEGPRTDALLLRPGGMEKSK